MTRDEAARWIGVSVRTVDRMIAAGELPSPPFTVDEVMQAEDAYVDRRAFCKYGHERDGKCKVCDRERKKKAA